MQLVLVVDYALRSKRAPPEAIYGLHRDILSKVASTIFTSWSRWSFSANLNQRWHFAGNNARFAGHPICAWLRDVWGKFGTFTSSGIFLCVPLHA